ncbi:hypothetical protein Cgig2_007140 [Carnegiea gigantea]|uniref:Uncharacterized protein n=1 Tax=Carnegiea gigantea TaxID=171969 RepID=A0A9Q1QL10_9CARY|nr:hypothetical protein Cgig2_007140 [Carnegiea gigantea]
MAAFTDLGDSPMFDQQVCSLEQTTDELKDRCQKLYKGSRKYVAALAEACNGDATFADALESFGGGQEDPLSLSIGGRRFNLALLTPILPKDSSRNTASRLEFRKTMLLVTVSINDIVLSEVEREHIVEHVLVDRLAEFMSVDLQDAKVKIAYNTVP